MVDQILLVSGPLALARKKNAAATQKTAVLKWFTLVVWEMTHETTPEQIMEATH